MPYRPGPSARDNKLNTRRRPCRERASTGFSIGARSVERLNSNLAAKISSPELTR